MRILTFCDYYMPGFKAGGPIRSISNLVAALGDDFRFFIVTRDRDRGDREAYPGIRPGSWQSLGKAQVCYVRKKRKHALLGIILRAEFDLYYINSACSLYFSVQILLMRKLGLIPKKPIIIAPRGEFSSGALAIKSFRKRLYFEFGRRLGLFDKVLWQASSAFEAADIQHIIGNARILVAPDLAATPQRKQLERIPKQAGSLRVVYLSRISPIKNLTVALMALSGVSGEVVFDIFGPIADQDYWAKCEQIIRKLPSNVQVRYNGVIDPDSVIATMSSYDLFYLPTKGENFGHVILEAFLAGCPVLISDQTPWRGLQEKGVGWDVSLDGIDSLTIHLQECLDMSSESFKVWSSRAYDYGVECSTNVEEIELNRTLFLQANRLSTDGIAHTIQ